jgi:hypothetical protein
MTNTAGENEGIVLFGADGTTYVIPMSALSGFVVSPSRDLPDPADLPDVTPLVAYQAPITPDTETAFWFVG